MKQKHKKQPPQRGRWHRQKDKNRSPSAKNQSTEIRISENANKKRFECVISIIGGREISRPYQNVGYRLEKFDAVFYRGIIVSSGVFRRETASGFYPWGNVVSPRKRVAEGLCGWRHGNSFPMTQSAQSLRQMQSIPRCPKAVFFMFLFLIPFTIRQQCIIYPHIFSTEPE